LEAPDVSQAILHGCLPFLISHPTDYMAAAAAAAASEIISRATPKVLVGDQAMAVVAAVAAEAAAATVRARVLPMSYMPSISSLRRLERDPILRLHLYFMQYHHHHHQQQQQQPEEGGGEAEEEEEEEEEEEQMRANFLPVNAGRGDLKPLFVLQKGAAAHRTKVRGPELKALRDAALAAGHILPPSTFRGRFGDSSTRGSLGGAAAAAAAAAAAGGGGGGDGSGSAYRSPHHSPDSPHFPSGSLSSHSAGELDSSPVLPLVESDLERYLELVAQAQVAEEDAMEKEQALGGEGAQRLAQQQAQQQALQAQVRAQAALQALAQHYRHGLRRAFEQLQRRPEQYSLAPWLSPQWSFRLLPASQAAGLEYGQQAFPPTADQVID
jgi:hypothetical protein